MPLAQQSLAQSPTIDRSICHPHCLALCGWVLTLRCRYLLYWCYIQLLWQWQLLHQYPQRIWVSLVVRYHLWPCRWMLGLFYGSILLFCRGKELLASEEDCPLFSWERNIVLMSMARSMSCVVCLDRCIGNSLQWCSIALMASEMEVFISGFED